MIIKKIIIAITIIIILRHYGKQRNGLTLITVQVKVSLTSYSMFHQLCTLQTYLFSNRLHLFEEREHTRSTQIKEELPGIHIKCAKVFHRSSFWREA